MFVRTAFYCLMKTQNVSNVLYTRRAYFDSSMTNRQYLIVDFTKMSHTLMCSISYVVSPSSVYLSYMFTICLLILTQILITSIRIPG